MEILNSWIRNWTLNGLVYGPEGKNWEKLKVKKRVRVLDGYKGNTTWVDGINNDSLYQRNVIDQQIADSKKDYRSQDLHIWFIFNTDNVNWNLSYLTNANNLIHNTVL